MAAKAERDRGKLVAAEGDWGKLVAVGWGKLVADERDRRNWLRGRPREMDLNWWRPRPREIEVSWWQPREIGGSLWRRREIGGSWWRRSPINPCLIGYPFSARPTSLVFCMWDLLQDECTYPGGVSSVLPSEY